LQVNTETGEAQSVDPSSDRWIAYYKEARVRRRARSPELRTSALRRRWRNRQRTLILGGIASIAGLLTLFYVVLSR
jgi:hypothetical protein